jgi:hypothetical protein
MTKIWFLITLTVFYLSFFSLNWLAAQAPSACNLADHALEIAAKIRDLKIIKKVPCQVEDKPTIRSFIEDRIREELGSDKLQEEALRFKALGIIPKQSDYQKLLMDLYESQVAGYYDNIKKRFVMASWLSDSVQLGIAVHEQTHALQDQHFNLTNFLEHKKYTSDELFARSALVEGDASIVMYNQANQSAGLPSLEELTNVNLYIMQNVIATGFLAESNPEAANLMQLMIFPYSSGLHFTHYLLKDNGFSAINRAFKQPPKSTEEILHPEKYGEAQDFEVLNIQDLRDMSKEKIDLFAADTLGEFSLGLYLKTLGIEADLATKAASGWAGDLIALSKSEKTKASWLILFDNQKEQDEFVEICSASLALKKIQISSILHKQHKGVLLNIRQ